MCSTSLPSCSLSARPSVHLVNDCKHEYNVHLKAAAVYENRTLKLMKMTFCIVSVIKLHLLSGPSVYENMAVKLLTGFLNPNFETPRSVCGVYESMLVLEKCSYCTNRPKSQQIYLNY